MTALSSLSGMEKFRNREPATETDEIEETLRSVIPEPVIPEPVTMDPILDAQEVIPLPEEQQPAREVPPPRKASS
jgi:hypothetical protein